MDPKRKTAARYALAAALALAAAAAMLRTLYTGLEIDEEYALSLGYRLVSGDRLFAQMWEPHQLSALTTAPLIALFRALTGGTTGVLLFVRGVMLAAKAGLGVWCYRSLRGALGRPAAYLAALGVFLFTPKWFLAPDYTSQQFHYTLAAFLCWYGYYAPGARQYRGLWRVAAGAVCACLSFLAYPQSVAAAPVLWLGMILLGRRGGEARVGPLPRGALAFAGGCAVCGGAFLLWVCAGMGFDLPALAARIGLVLHDPQYDFTAAQRLAVLAGQALTAAKFAFWPLLAALALWAVWLWCRRPEAPRAVEALLWLFTACLSVRCAQYALADVGLDFRHLYLAAAVAGGCTFWLDRRCAQGGTARAVLFWLGWLPGLAAYLMILRSTLIGLSTTFMYLFWPAVCGAAALALRRPAASRGRGLALAVLGVFFLAAPLTMRLGLVQRTGWRAVPAGTALTRIETGPAKGIWADETAADMQQCLYEALAPYAGQKVLQAIGEQHGLGFLMADGTLEVAQASVISGTDSDPRFEQYYTDVPDKLPDVILYDDAEVRDMAAFHAWIEEHFAITGRCTVTHGTASLQVLVVDGWAGDAG